jgi:mono/diheme cytochrome c family protein
MLFWMTKCGAPEETTVKSNTPTFSGVLSDNEIWAVLGYVKSRWPESTRRHQAEIDRLDLNRMPQDCN